tara:strand:+ start:138 stop:581 length:444 start_codon:yes stop_codon:yes gene_type:complete
MATYHTTFGFTSGSVLTASKMNMIQENFTTLTEQLSGTPTVEGYPKAWFSMTASGTFDATTEQYNITSVTRLAFGKFQANFASTLVFSGTYGATWGFRAGAGHTSNVIKNITLYTMASSFIRFKGRNANTSSDGDDEFPMHIAIWQE